MKSKEIPNLPSSVFARRAAALAGAILAVISLSAADPAAFEQSKKEAGLLVYGNIAADNFGPAAAGFRKKYPWIKLEMLDTGPAVAFERYYAETSAGRRSADAILAAAPSAWVRFAQKGEALPYVAAEDEALPKWSKPFPGVYTLSTDPLLLVYNKLLLPPERRPKSITQLIQLAKKYPQDFDGRLTTYDASRHPFAYAIHWTYVNRYGAEGWKKLAALGPLTRPEGAGSSMVEKLTTGEFTAIYFGSGLTFMKRILDAKGGDLLEWSLIGDGTPVMLRGMAITRKAKSPYSAQLFIDYLLSHEGQVALGRGGLTPYRSDVQKDEVPFLTYEQIRQQIGDENIVIIGYDEQMLADEEKFVAKWQALFPSVKR
ncbi:MAG: extracellular solute-binding protein [Opitutaceae bacterium]|nr:extracellular solute-binding protein [Opitutaceae bacterium]